jgi:hypothetical protein
MPKRFRGMRIETGRAGGLRAPVREEGAVKRSLAAWVVAMLSAALGSTAYAQAPTCVTACQQKVDACARNCEDLADAVYRDPASLRQCQLACAQQLFVSCFERCAQTGEVVEDDYGVVAEHPDRVPAAARARKAPAAPEKPGSTQSK